MLPITSVVLYKHGVGYFERAGSISGEARVELSFRASEMNDVLKSLTVLEHEGGEVTSIAYESTQSLHRQLEDFAIELPEGRAISGLLAQLTGTRAVVHRAEGRSEGRVTGIERTARHVDGHTIEGHRVALWVDEGAIESHDLDDVTRIELVDEGLRQDLQHLLDILISAKKKDKKRLTIHARGDGERTLAISYVVETPVWKTSYRVLLYAGEGGEEAQTKAQIQGWALVDNTQDEDWTQVQLSLVAGLPISFVHDLYSPRHQRRPEVAVRTEAAYAPPTLEHGVSDAAMEESYGASGAPPPAPAAMAAMAPRSARAKGRGAPPPPPQATAVNTETVGDLLHYEIAAPVTVARKQSALVPILHRPFEGRRVAVYNEAVRAQNPMSAILFKNTTGLTLEGGPLTVLEQGAYVGEAMLDTLTPDEERLVPYSVELGCRVRKTQDDERTDVHRVRVVDGAVRLIRYRVLATTYLIEHRGDASLQLFLDHPVRPGYELHETADPVERTDNFTRFSLDLPPRETTRFEVKQRGEQYESVAIGSVDTDRIALWFEQQIIDDELRAKLDHIAGLSSERAKVQRRVAAVQSEVDTIVSDQKRLRDNLQALGTASDERQLRQRYVAELSAQEDRLAELSQDQQGYRRQLDGLESQLRAAIEALEA